ncbi:ATP-binding cassette domain-containing protein [Nocardioides cynanchi]|uniref:ATP-binding cassette domain-containing protein n=1 Tax=Nocardioides cynanchi TaxID=2558918 RepID=UPI0012482F58|nr:ATP-binding cassette domain-containing protein [Nocardioides cynanchi]
MIEVREVSKRYARTVALDKMSFEVRPGVVTGFLGPNGAGKSTTFRILLGLDRPDEGSGRVLGRRYADLPRPMTRVGVLLDARAVAPRLSARNHLLALARSNGLSRSRVDEMLELSGLAGAADRAVGRFSLGMAQRLGIAAALLGDPPVLMLDEPVNGLDPDGILWLRELLRDLAAEGRTVFLSSHLMSEVALTATDLVVVGAGRVIAETTVDEVVDRASESGVTVRSPELHLFAEVLRARGFDCTALQEDPPAVLVRGCRTDDVGQVAAEHGIVLHELAPRRASLEDAYFELTRNAAQYQSSRLPGPEADDAARADASGPETASAPTEVAA